MVLNAKLSIYKTLRIMKLSKMGFNAIVNIYTKLSAMTLSIKALNMAPSIMMLSK